MKNKKGFTLIELLVVILIIGILAAVALPQYKKMTLKSEFSTVKAMTRALYDAEKRYRIANGSYTDDFTALDTEIDNSKCSMTQASIFCQIRTKEGVIQYIIEKSSGKRRCDASPGNTNSITNKICQLDTGRTVPNGCNETLYCRYYY